MTRRRRAVRKVGLLAATQDPLCGLSEFGGFIKRRYGTQQ